MEDEPFTVRSFSLFLCFCVSWVYLQAQVGRLRPLRLSAERQQWRQATDPLDTTTASLISSFHCSSLPPPLHLCLHSSPAALQI